MIAGLGNLPLCVIKYPSGKFGFVGSVPTDLAFISSKPDYLETARICGPGFATKAAEREGGIFKTRVWDTEAEARAEATRLGHSVK